MKYSKQIKRQLLAGLGILIIPLSVWAQAEGEGDDAFTIHAFTSFEYEYQIDELGNGDPNGSFDNDQIDLVFGYTRDDFRIAVDAVFEHGSASEDDLGNVGLSFAFAEYSINESLDIRFGKYYSPLGIYNEYNTVKSGFLPVKIPLATNKPGKMTGNGFTFFPRRQVGMGILGDIPVGEGTLSYNLAVSNGDQDATNPFEEDNNTQKAISARINFETSNEFTIGVSHYADSGTLDGNLRSFGIHTKYNGSFAQIWAEVDTGTIEFDNGDPDLDQLGGFVEVGFPLDSGFTPYVQFQYAETETDLLKQSARITVAGVSYTLKEYAIVKFENAYHKGSSDNSRYDGIPGRNYNEIRAAFVLGF
jgi:hypothetical protein